MAFSPIKVVISISLVTRVVITRASHLTDPNIPCKTWSLGLTAQKDKAPYDLFIYQKASVAPGDTGIELLLMAPVSVPPFIGFILEILWGTDPVGKFNPENSCASSAAQDCGGMVGNVMMHKDLTPKRMATIEWIAPLNGVYAPRKIRSIESEKLFVNS